MSDGADLSVFLEMQRRLEEDTFGLAITELDGEDFLEFVRWNVLALEDELHEMLQECSWKPWAKDTSANRDRMLEELIDALHFMLNLFIAINGDVTPELLALRIATMYKAKHTVNIERQEDGYDGIRGKCPECHRDLTEAGTYTIEDNGMIFTICDGCKGVVTRERGRRKSVAARDTASQ